MDSDDGKLFIEGIARDTTEDTLNGRKVEAKRALSREDQHTSSGSLPSMGAGFNFERTKGFVWLIRFTCHEGRGEEKEEFYFHGTGFTVNNRGLILTCSHVPPAGVADYTITARRMDEGGFVHDLTVVQNFPEYDILCLKVLDLKHCEHAELEEKEELHVGEELATVGHPGDLVWTSMIGNVAYGFMKKPIVSMPTDKARCETHKSNGFSSTHRYRTTGNIWNKRVFREIPSLKDPYTTNLHPQVPIVQIYGFIAEKGLSGAPVLNKDGKVVGMMDGGFKDHAFAIHVSMLQHVLRHLLPKAQKKKKKKKKNKKNKKAAWHCILKRSHPLLGMVISGGGVKKKKKGMSNKLTPKT